MTLLVNLRKVRETGFYWTAVRREAGRYGKGVGPPTKLKNFFNILSMSLARTLRVDAPLKSRKNQVINYVETAFYQTWTDALAGHFAACLFGRARVPAGRR